jgi:hypothetical protein
MSKIHLLVLIVTAVILLSQVASPARLEANIRRRWRSGAKEI